MNTAISAMIAAPGHAWAWPDVPLLSTGSEPGRSGSQCPRCACCGGSSAARPQRGIMRNMTLRPGAACLDTELWVATGGACIGGSGRCRCRCMLWLHGLHRACLGGAPVPLVRRPCAVNITIEGPPMAIELISGDTISRNRLQKIGCVWVRQHRDVQSKYR